MIRPLELSTNFELYAYDPFRSYVCSRMNTPNVEALEEKLARLENAQYCLAFNSGMAAITALFLGVLKLGERLIVSEDCYSATYQFCAGFLKDWGVTTNFVDHRDMKNIKNAIKDNTKMIFIETPSNPMLHICDLTETKKIIIKENFQRRLLPPILFAIDNTFATPLLQKPLEIGADFVIHSTTKAINGHSTAVGGAIITKSQHWHEKLLRNRTIIGPIQQPMNAWLTTIGLKTMEVRVTKQCETAMRLAEWLEKQPEIQYVLYPGLKSFPQKELATQQMKAGGTMISFAVKGNLETAKKFLKALEKISVAVSLGSVDSYIEIPYTMSHHDISFGRIPDNLIRFSVGLENFEKLQEDLSRGLQAIK
ncbi:MAG: aminotransferase class I/II-fold pyridoxal phosphate-dependent enzyme [Patescibacteria group bacterium]